MTHVPPATAAIRTTIRKASDVCAAPRANPARPTSIKGTIRLSLIDWIVAPASNKGNGRTGSLGQSPSRRRIDFAISPNSPRRTFPSARAMLLVEIGSFPLRSTT